MTSLYAQLESLTTTVAQLRRDAPRRAAAAYAEQLKKTLEEDDDDAADDDDDEEGMEDTLDRPDANGQGQDVEMPDAGENGSHAQDRTTRPRRNLSRSDWKLHLPVGTDHEAERWRSGEMAEVYEDALRTLLRLQGGVPAGEAAGATEEAADGNGLATTVGKAERAARAVDVVEKK